MDYLEVPSRFLGVDEVISANRFGPESFQLSVALSSAWQDQLEHDLDEEIWKGLMNDVGGAHLRKGNRGMFLGRVSSVPERIFNQN